MKLALHICISGFMQDESQGHGVFSLAEKLHLAGHSTGIQSRVWLREWNSDWAAVAEHVFLLKREYTNTPSQPMVNIYGYSWGGGWGSIQLAKELHKIGIPVCCMVLCDPVYRSPYWCMRWRSLFRRDWWFAPVIKIPTNVEVVRSFYQTNNWPQAHHLVADAEHTVMNDPIKLDRTHSYMEDALVWHAVCTEEAEVLKDELIASLGE